MARTERERSAHEEGTPGVPEGEAEGAPSGPPAAPGLEGGPSPFRRRWGPAVVLLVLVAAALGTFSVLRRPAERPRVEADASGQPANWRLAGESLTVFDATGALVFEHRFGFPLRGAVRSETPAPVVGSARVLIADVDQDGRSEVLVRPNAMERVNRKLFCFEEDGRVRFVHQPTGTRTFGDDEYSDPWFAHRVFVTRGRDGARRLWSVFIHNLLFPSVLQELDPRSGTVRQEYWSNGYIETVAEESWAGRPVVLVGATNNDFRAATASG